MFAAAAAAIIFTLVLALARAALGPTAYDRILAVNMAATKTVLLIAVAGFLTGPPRLPRPRPRLRAPSTSSPRSPS